MKRGQGVHTVPTARGGWCNKVNGRVRSEHGLKYQAVRMGREIARALKVEHYIHRKDGVITQANSYGNDPCPPRDGR